VPVRKGERIGQDARKVEGFEERRSRALDAGI